MDARRPLRSAAASSGNENIVFSKQPTHHRQKSLGNLKAMATTGALNAPPKRTAFGDVSNTARARVVDPIGKPANRETVKIRAKAVTTTVSTRDVRLEDKENRKGGAKESRSKAIKASKGTGYATKTQSSVPFQTANPASRGSAVNQSHAGTSLAQPPLRNGASKKATTIYQDRKEERGNDYSEAASPVDDLAITVAKPAKNPRHYKSQPLLRTEQHSLRHQDAKCVVPTDRVEVEEEGDIDDNVTEAAYEDAVEQLSQNAEAGVRGTSAEMEQANYRSLRQGENDAALQPKALPELPSASELEEYWDEEEEQELYDEQGYTTAHSYRSHGDNTTSGPTTLLAPHVTTSVQEELEMAKAYVADHQTEEEIEEEAWDVSMVAEYGDEIFGYMRELEAQMLPNPHYMDDQTEIQWSMRSVLMDWLVQVHHRFCLLPETLFLTVNYIDRFLSVKVVSLGKLQLVGATALFVAAKYEEINCPSVQEIVYMVDSGYSVDEILKAERFMLSMLHFELGWPGPMSFLRRISKADDYDLETRTLAKYFLEITIMDERFVSSPPSFLAAGAHCISRLFLGKGDWTLAHVHYSGYTLSQLKPLIKLLFECCQFPAKHHSAVYEKYATQKYKHSSTFVEGKIASGLTLSQLYAGSVLHDTSSILGDDLTSQYPASRLLIPTQG
ncbi:cyclin-like protein [Corynascus novoguineensis]|uniref:Cyclin-like protein n=1 Tax=Corynascus novoguineensis TaxID=1126955 RepID=A0AAN7CML2_9PEZI|nr:cyclin-like protein [Corynascus novoguineensis]